MNKTGVARIARSVGFGRIIDDNRVRKIFGVAPKVHKVSKSRKSAPIRGSENGSSLKLGEDLGEKKNFNKLSQVRPKTTVKKDGPLVSVVVPVYNVEKYVDSSIKSLLEQDYDNIQVIIVDDGSTDSSPAIVDEIEKRDVRVEVIHTTNKGLGAARNTGLEKAQGKYITFIDSDDFVTPHGLSKMVETLESTGSAFVVGSIERFDSKHVWQPQWVLETHSETRLSISLNQHPEILYDVFAWNKLYRLDIWREIVGAFPEGILYEDQEGTASLYTSGLKFDVLEDVVYRWRLRDEGTSITQNKTSVEDLEQRLEIARRVEEIVTLRGSKDTEVVDFWYAKLLGEDLYWYYREMPRASEEFGRTLIEAYKHFGQKVTIKSVQQMPFDRRILYFALENGDAQAFASILNFFVENGSHWTTEFVDGNYLAYSDAESYLPFLLADEQRKIDPKSLKAKCEIFDQEMLDSGSVLIRASVYIENLKDDAITDVKFELIQQGSSQTAEIIGRPVHDNRVDCYSNNPFIDRAESVYEFLFDVDQLSGFAYPPRSTQSEPIQITACLASGTILHKTDAIRTNSSLGLNQLLSGELAQNGTLLAFKTSGKKFETFVLRPRFVLQDWFEDQGQLSLTLKLNNPVNFMRQHKAEGGLTVRALRPNGEELFASELTHNDKGVWGATVTIPRALTPGKENFISYELVVSSRNQQTFPIAVRSRSQLGHLHPGVSFNCSGWGYARIERAVQYSFVDSVDYSTDENSLIIKGVVYFDKNAVRQAVPSFALVSNQGVVVPHTSFFDSENRKFEVKFKLDVLDEEQRRVSLPSLDYILQILQPVGKALPASIWPRVSEATRSRFYREWNGKKSRIYAMVTPGGLGLKIRLASPLNINEIGKRNQYRIICQVFGDTRTINENSALFESFAGSSRSDSPAELAKAFRHQLPDTRLYWTVKDMSFSVPEGTEPVIRYSRQWWELLATAKWLVNNNNFPAAFRKHADQVYIQTWHGTPLKKIGNDVPQGSLSLGYRLLMNRETTEYWNYLLAQNEWAGNVMQQAFGFTGDVISKGYPRNDTLQTESGAERRNLLRNFFGISQNQTVVLYAPTWRDNKKVASGNYDFVNFLDFGELRKNFGTQVVVLARGHSNTLKSGRSFAASNVIDVSLYPDINDLILASDVLITDYSSVMFDYVVGIKPIYFLVPDLHAYSSDTRGFYLDFQTIAPGPLLKNTREVVEQLKRLRQTGFIVDEKYESFRNRFAPFDDGERAEKILKEIRLLESGKNVNKKIEG